MNHFSERSVSCERQILDVCTLGLWEIAGTPLELATKKEATTFVLYYGADNKLKACDAIK